MLKGDDKEHDPVAKYSEVLGWPQVTEASCVGNVVQWSPEQRGLILMAAGKQRSLALRLTEFGLNIT
jgi:hypothetical protein